MKKITQILILASAISAVGVAPSFGNNGRHLGWDNGGGGHGGGAPAPEIGAGVLGMLLAGGAAVYIRRRARG